MDLENVINLRLLSNPVNYVIVWLLLAIAGAIYLMLAGYAKPSPVSLSLNS